MPRKTSKTEDSNFENDIKTVLKKLNLLEQKLNHLPLFIPKKHSGKADSRESSCGKKPSLAPVFSGVTLKKTKSVKKGFITWPSDDDKPTSSTDRVSYVMNRWESQTSHEKVDDLFSEPSDFVDFLTDFVGDRRMYRNSGGITDYVGDRKVYVTSGGNSIKESKACALSKRKNSTLES
ncbi:hypothetical protein GE061_010472 [Apolygus lucorum]|uniref:Uncharacterized protein n=1 Tax=Apolygus lucorum TaxID=248454 RepID=A0A8S9XVZ7_APOLU|nr:hypothetical protein GE061_010472 [Apolygus lucorum]